MDKQMNDGLDERWLDYQVALESTIATLRSDAANRHALPKAWVAFVAKIALFSLVGSASFLLVMYAAFAYPLGWFPDSIGLAIKIWSTVTLVGAPLLLTIFPAPIGYWEQRADEVLKDVDLPSKHRTF
ncbi:hypothetical protein [Stutzerimonas stutzeri]|uniref:hypothetical protein n=1 Tax=Stutzerimonas stutzeri TaxID=316 RepID=UPI0015E3A676|nr:hypothetical protein [Stutzerimonas stutzeri]MBA1280304.1 hypothetical protein [Stutzerimonas stutzeri]